MKNATHRRTISSPPELFAVVAAAVALMVVPLATPASTPLLVLGPTTIANGTAVVNGAVGSQAAGGTLTVNGQPLALGESGHFAGSVSLNGAGSLELVVANPRFGEQTRFEIPLTGTLLTLGGVIPGDVLSALQQAGITVLVRVPGAKLGPVIVAGSVVDKTRLAALTVDGTDVLGTVSENGSFKVRLPRTTRTLTVTATDTHGVSRTTVTKLRQASMSVSAAEAAGVRIAAVRYRTAGVRRTHRVGMIVTVKDRRGLLIRGAKIRVWATKPGRLAHRPRAVVSGPKGRAAVTLRLRRGAFGKRLVTITAARTPSATAKKRTAVRIPRLKKLVR